MPVKRKQTAADDERSKKRVRTKAETHNGTSRPSKTRKKGRGAEHSHVQEMDEHRLEIDEKVTEEQSSHRSEPNARQADSEIYSSPISTERARTRQHLSLLRDGRHPESPGYDHIRACRDHYDRFGLFMARQYPASPQILFADPSTTTAAIAAARYSSLGITDTIVREFITYWLAELESFLVKSLVTRAQIELFGSIFDGLKEYISGPLSLIDCSNSEQARLLRSAATSWIRRYLLEFCELYKNVMSDSQRSEYRRQMNDLHDVKDGHSRTDYFPEARILDSSLAWDLHQLPQKESCGIKIHFVEGTLQVPDFTAGPNPADNGSAWSDGTRSDIVPKILDEMVKLPIFPDLGLYHDSKPVASRVSEEPIVISDDEDDPLTSLDRILKGKPNMLGLECWLTDSESHGHSDSGASPSKECCTM